MGKCFYSSRTNKLNNMKTEAQQIIQVRIPEWFCVNQQVIEFEELVRMLAEYMADQEDLRKDEEAMKNNEWEWVTLEDFLKKYE